MRRPSPVIAIFMTVFLDMLAFGLVIPDIQVRADSLGGEGFVRGFLLATYSIAQTPVAPFLGRWSDQIGRRPIMLVTTAVFAISWLFYANAETLWIMFASRALCGIAGANMSVAYAYVADATAESDRTKAMGLLGAAFGLGFIFGPVIGAQLLAAGNDKPALMAYVSFALACVNFAFIYFFLPEPKQHDATAGRRATLKNLQRALTTPTLGLLIGLFFAYSFAFSNLESTYFLLAVNYFGLTKLQGSYVLAVVGITSAIMQGGLVRLFSARFGDVKCLRAAFLIQAPALFLIPWAPPWFWHLFGAVALAFGSGLGQPCLSSLVSKVAPPDMRGAIFGVNQSVGAFARILGPVVASALYDMRFFLPYALAGIVTLIPAMGMFAIREPESVPVAAVEG
ncbi:MAG: Tetracycline resistance protein, class B [Fimbriimonadaceae bacterium]|nr:Tetracycline resistance protein, class B [Fimbriimonadaceae bacterium]